ncbi:TonB-dependent receptor [Psychrobium sp. 1_MG-2023]|uniref:TonB-dependent receptor n=1 Tax=Psychrobium sp. 1_MG-2023 TaxID=3062624 RepID=UPI000C326F12|nr:TonB-dependent receptor [Psychrobium sp. 1_MG-2023]MDP2561946.1 TonB-dependent receptor [Psychrobium sp. 1_MG-2023]PKF58672.1 hypothetical protein CW748_03285 [Alteromonadales bacterium alter-6D02]
MFKKSLVLTGMLAGGYFVSAGVAAEANTSDKKKSAEQIETIEVKSKAHLLRSDLDSLISSTLVEREQLDIMQASSLGETLKTIPGVHSSYFGPSSSSPVIRGLDGPRIKVMQNGLDGGDASRSAPDHQVSSESSTAQEIEVLRGPATLLHGSGAIGGVVNVVDQRIPQALVDETSTELSASFNSANKEKNAAFKVLTAQGDIGLYVDGFVRDAQEMQTPSFYLHEEHEHDDHEEHEHDDHEEHGHDDHGHDEDKNTKLDHIENSQAKSSGLTFGTSYITDKQVTGISVGFIKSEYGLIGHEHDEHDEHDEHEHDEHEHDEHEHEHDEALPIAKTEQYRVQFSSQWFNPFTNVSELSLKAAYTDYQLQEIEHGHVATQIDTLNSEAKLQLTHQWLPEWEGIAGIHYLNNETNPVGEEANSPSTITESWALFLTQKRQIDQVELHVGARIEQVDITPDLELAGAVDNVQFTPASFSAGMSWQVNKQHQLLTNLSHSQRALSANELFSFGEHLGTASFDVGVYFNMASEHDDALLIPSSDYNKLETEDATTIDLGWRYDGDKVVIAASLFYSEVDNFAYQALSPLHNDHGLPIYEYQQDNVVLKGGELQLSYFHNDHLTLTSFIDYTAAELEESGEYLPRIPPMRFATQMNYEHQDWHFNLLASYYAKQSDVAHLEEPTDAYTLVDLSIYKHQALVTGQLKYYLKLSNIFDEKANVHSSFLKEQAPLPGVSAKVGLRWSF